MEEGTVILIGATTENPFFYINAPLLSRTRLVVFEKIGREDIRRLLERALEDKERGLGELSVEADPRALDYLADLAEGDARVALNALETAVLSAGSGREKIRLSLPLVQEVLPGRPLEYDREGDSHYDMASALIKSIRGSDPDAALYWMSRMLQGGEDPLFIARRLIISAAEDVGNADPRALPLAVAAAQAVQFIGMPEGRIPLAQAAAYLASAPKSNAAYLALEEALAEVERSGNQPVPSHLRDGSYRGAARLGRGRGYLYPHDYPGHYVPQLYLPEALKDKRFYRPTEQGFEKQIRERLQRLRSRGVPAMSRDCYYVPRKPVRARIAVGACRFIGTLAPVSGEEEAQELIQAVRKEFPDATHHAYALSIGCGASLIERCHDDGGAGPDRRGAHAPGF